MGVVYTPEEIQEGRIPDLDAHKRAGRFVLERLRNSFCTMAFRGGMIYGSTVQQPTRRSDLDVLTVYDPAFLNAGGLDLLAGLYKETEDKFHVRTEGNTLLLNRNSVADDHEIDPLFGMSLIRLAERHPEWRVGDPLKHLPLDDLTPELAITTARKYAAHKERRFLKSLIDSSADSIDYTGLQRALELPGALGRKAIDALDYSSSLEQPQRDRFWFASQAEEILGEYSSNLEALSIHKALKAQDAEYTDVLEDAASGDVANSKYEYWLKMNYRPALHNARKLATAWKVILGRV